MAVTAHINDETNPKQVKAFNAVMGMLAYYEQVKAVRAENAVLKAQGKKLRPIPKPPTRAHTLRQFFYGGGIRGGKTFLYLVILVLLSRRYPKSRWHIIRAAMPDLTRNTEPSLLKILGDADVRWKRGGSEYFVEFNNGSRIYFLSENFHRDPDLNRFKGLETNGFLLEQIEELSQDTYNKAIERAGSYYIEDMPPPLVLATFNPAFNWIKNVIHERWLSDPDSVPFHYTIALAKDNSTVTQEQWEQWSNLDDVTYARYIEGQWEIDLKGRFMYAFDEKRHVKEVEYDPAWPLYYSFDFNVDPACAVVFQTDGESFFHILDEVRMENADTPSVCDALKSRWRHLDPDEYVTGDASGLARISGLRNHLSQYNVIANELGLDESRFMLSRSNPTIADSRMFCNSIWSRFPNVYLHPRCKWTKHDLNFVEIRRASDGSVEIQKTGKLKHAPLGAESMGHLLDCTRYAMHNTLFNFVELPKS
jgi:hypothetical protein